MKFALNSTRALSVLCAFWGAQASAQVLEAGHEADIGQLLGDDAPCSFEGASIGARLITARYQCGRLRITHRSLACDPTGDCTPAGSFTLHGTASLRAFAGERLRARDDLWSTPTPMRSEVSILERASPFVASTLFFVMLLGFARPRRRPHHHRFALWTAMAVMVVGALAGPWGSVHEHHTFLARIDCAATMGCFGDRPGWYAPIYALYAPLARSLPAEQAALAALSLSLSLLALWALFEWMIDATRRPFAAGTAVLLIALHPAVPRLAASLSFWPLALALLFTALRLSLRADKSLRSRAGASAAWALTWCTSVAFTLLLPLGVVVLWPRQRRTRSLLLLALCVGLAAAYALPFAGEAALPEMLTSFEGQALFEPSVVPVGLAIACLSGVFIALRSRATRGWPLLLLPALILGSPITVGYPTVFLHAFPLIFFYGVLGGLALAAVSSRSLRLALVALTLFTYVGAGEARIFARYQAPIARELRWLERAILELPPHERLVVGPVIHPPLEGHELEGDPVEVRFPRRFHQAHHYAEILGFNEWLRNGSPLEGTLVYIGLGEQLFHPGEHAERDESTDDGLRDEARALLERFEWDALVHADIDMRDSPHVISRGRGTRARVRFIRPARRR